MKTRTRIIAAPLCVLGGALAVQTASALAAPIYMPTSRASTGRPSSRRR